MPRNFFRECFDGQARRAMPEDMFRQTFCRLCRNPECELALAGQTKWQSRISTQVDRLLDNPDIADPDDPRFAHIRDIDFPSMFRQAMALEISAQRGDWEIPSQEDAIQLATTGRVVVANPKKTEGTPKMDNPPPEGSEPEPPKNLDVLWEGNVRSDSGRTYQVALAGIPGEDPAWSCTCPAFQYGRVSEGDGFCKHIRWVQARVGGDPQPPEVASKTPPEAAAPSSPEPTPRRQPPAPAPRNPLAEPGPRQRPFIPRMQNTPAPSEGVMIGGGPPPATPPAPAHDPWAVPAPAENVIPVGEKVRLGLTGKTKKES